MGGTQSLSTRMLMKWYYIQEYIKKAHYLGLKFKEIQALLICKHGEENFSDSGYHYCSRTRNKNEKEKWKAGKYLDFVKHFVKGEKWSWKWSWHLVSLKPIQGALQKNWKNWKLQVRIKKYLDNSIRKLTQVLSAIQNSQASSYY